MFVEDMDHYITSPIRQKYLTDLRFVGDYLEAYDSVDAGQWTQASRMVYRRSFTSRWPMNCGSWTTTRSHDPLRMPMVRSIVSVLIPPICQESSHSYAIRDELTQYLALNNKPAEDEMSRIRNSINGVVDDRDAVGGRH